MINIVTIKHSKSRWYLVFVERWNLVLLSEKFWPADKISFWLAAIKTYVHSSGFFFVLWPLRSLLVCIGLCSTFLDYYFLFDRFIEKLFKNGGGERRDNNGITATYVDKSKFFPPHIRFALAQHIVFTVFVSPADSTCSLLRVFPSYKRVFP